MGSHDSSSYHDEDAVPVITVRLVIVGVEPSVSFRDSIKAAWPGAPMA